MKLILIRHGETEENVAGIIQGHIPGKLTKEGKEQVEKVGLRLKDEKIDAIYTSSLARAKETAEAIAQYHPGIPFILSDGIREFDVGEITGKHKDEVGEVDWDNNPPKGAETRDDVAARVKKVLDLAYEKYKDKTIAFVSHGGTCSIIYSVILKKPLEEIKTMERIKNTSVTVFEFKENLNHEIILFNCTEHL